MPKSKVRDKTKKRQAEAGQRSQEAMLRERKDWQTKVGWVLVAIGAILFLGGNIGARTGLSFLPFDPHHVYAQLGGALLAMVGLMWALRR